MLTIKHQERNGHESLVACRSCHYNPEDNTVEVFGAEVDDGGAFERGHGKFGTGTIYVMNHNGATVAKYGLGWPATSQEPITINAEMPPTQITSLTA